MELVRLETLCDEGEGQEIEFIESFPTNTHDLAKEIAAFGTSNQGTILLGVRDDGSVKGLTDVNTPQKKDGLLRRIEGICHGPIKPSITPKLSFVDHSDGTVLAITIESVDQPVYYSKHVPYIRHITQSRPAEPHEVFEIINDWIQNTDQDDSSAEVSELFGTIVEIIIYSDEVESRMLNPWFDNWKISCEQWASIIRELVTEDVIIELGMKDALTSLADILDELSSFVMYSGFGDEFNQLVQNLQQETLDVKSKYLDKVPVSDDAFEAILRQMKKQSRKLSDLTSRIERDIYNPKFTELLEEASDIGLDLLRFSYYNISELDEKYSTRIRSVGRDLHLLETIDLRILDGGSKRRDTIVKITSYKEEFQKLLEYLE
ncbi:helix-turn-helix domain-containing protein [Candidatus Neomarinimicrobiota bacterium]